MLFNSTVWICSLTSRPNLTYAEALESEKNARKWLKTFIPELKAPIIFVASLTKRTGISDLVDDIFNYVHVRFFKEECVFAIDKTTGKEIWRECQVLSILPPANTPPSQYDPIKVQYRVKRIDSDKPQMPWLVNGDQIRRRRINLTKDKLKLFLKQCVECNDKGQLTIKEACYTKYITDAGITRFGDIFVGKQPTFELSKVLLNKMKNEKNELKKKKKKTDDTKQPSISKFFSKDDAVLKKDKNENKVNKVSQKEAKEMAKSLKEEMLRKRLESEAKAAQLKKENEERERQLKMELLQLVQATVRNFNKMRNDLELQDQRMLPTAKPVKTLIPDKYFGDAIMVLEFICSFSSALEDKDKFPKGYSLAMLERSLLCREVAGPLSDIIQILLGTIFSLQMEEENEVEVNYMQPSYFTETKKTFSDAVRDATAVANWTTSKLSMALNLMPMDATTVTELLRLHLLMSGAQVDENCSRWRYQHRGGYENTDDPALLLRTKYPHILRALGSYTVYQLPTSDILKILHCLICQILTYSSIKDIIEERLENSSKSRTALKNSYQAQRKRENVLAAEKKELSEELKKKVDIFEGTPEELAKFKERLNTDLETKTKHLDYQADKAKELFNSEVLEMQQDIFSYQLYLGADRAFRSYWLFESVPGLFIEHLPFGGQCLETPVKNITELAYCSQQERYNYIKRMVSVKSNPAGNDKENKIDNLIEVKRVNGTEVKTDTTEIIKKDTVSQLELLMCTGQKDTCPVHNKHDANRVVWSYLQSEEEILALINSLNVRGVREKQLKEQLESEKDLILNHIKECPVNKLSVEPSDREQKIKELYATKSYVNANMNYPAGTEISVIVEQTLVDSILELEMSLTTGHLGTLNVQDRDAWREALAANDYDMQCDKLVWGANKQFSESKFIFLCLQFYYFFYKNRIHLSPL